MSNNDYRVQVFKTYGVEFSINIPTIDETFARYLINYLYNDSTIIEQEGSDYILPSIELNEEINKNTSSDKYKYVVRLNAFKNSNKCIVAGMIVSSTQKVPYFFICAGQTLSFWKTDIENYDGDFLITDESFMVEDKLGIKKENDKIVLCIPRKSSYLIGKYQDVIIDQDRYKYESTSDSINLFVFKENHEKPTTATSMKPTPVLTKNTKLRFRKKF